MFGLVISLRSREDRWHSIAQAQEYGLLRLATAGARFFASEIELIVVAARSDFGDIIA
jgi:hypothetical protein